MSAAAWARVCRLRARASTLRALAELKALRSEIEMQRMSALVNGEVAHMYLCLYESEIGCARRYRALAEQYEGEAAAEALAEAGRP